MAAEAGPVVAIIQARMGSTRLPGKVLKPLGSRVVLGWVVSRARQAELVDHVLVATSSQSGDEPVVRWCQRQDVEVFRGPEHDVLERFYLAAESSKADTIVRLTGDCPLLDPLVVDRVVETYKSRRNLDYVGTDNWFPEGFGVEVFGHECLKIAHEEATRASDREHVTPYIWRNGEQFEIERVQPSEDLSAYRLTLDYPVDLRVLESVVEMAESHDYSMGLETVIDILRSRPELAEMNRHIPYQEGYNISLLKEEMDNPAEE